MSGTANPAAAPTYGDWTAQPVTSVETIDAAPVTALSALLDSGLHSAVGEVLPPLWHWVALPRWSPSSELSADGHPRRGGFLPPVDLPRRMFAGGEVVLKGELRVGEQVEREAIVERITEKDGRSGRMVVVQTRTRLRSVTGDLLLEERQDIVYRPAAEPDRETAPDADPAAAMTPSGPPLTAKDAGWRFVTDPTLLMRFSAATANAHRIHYDWPYATRAEGYPGLVVHGPLSTIALAEALRLGLPRRRVTRLSHRLTSPLFCGEEATITHSTRDENATTVAEAQLRKAPGTLVAAVTATLTD